MIASALSLPLPHAYESAQYLISDSSAEVNSFRFNYPSLVRRGDISRSRISFSVVFRGLYRDSAEVCSSLALGSLSFAPPSVKSEYIESMRNVYKGNVQAWIVVTNIIKQNMSSNRP